NVVDMAVGIVIGAAFGKIVASVVNDIIMPPIGLLVGGVNFSELQVVLKEAVGETAAVTINYGNFIQVVFDFLIIAFAIFMVVKSIRAAKKTEAAASAAPPTHAKKVRLLGEIRHMLKNK